MNYLPCIWCKRCCNPSCMHAPLSPDLYPLSRTWKATPRICSVFLLSPPSLSILASVVTDEERWSHLWRGSVQHCIAPRPHPTTQHKSDHTTRTFRRALMNRFLYLSQLCCNAGLERIGTAHYSKVHLVHLLYSAKLLYYLIWVLKCSIMHSGCRWMKKSFVGWR